MLGFVGSAGSPQAHDRLAFLPRSLDDRLRAIARAAVRAGVNSVVRLSPGSATEEVRTVGQRSFAAFVEHRSQIWPPLVAYVREHPFVVLRLLRAMTDLATTSLEARMGAVFTRRLRELDGKAKEILGAALKSTPGPAVVRSAFELPAEQRATIQNALNETFSADIHLRFETTPNLVSGIELTANGQKVAWSIADYLASLEKGVSDLLSQQDKPEPVARPKAIEAAPVAS